MGRIKLGQGIATDDMCYGQPLTATYSGGKQTTTGISETTKESAVIKLHQQWKEVL